jgi:hypothetical protein
MGLLNCVGNDVSGVAFESGNSVCIISKGLEEDYLDPKETNFNYGNVNSTDPKNFFEESSTIRRNNNVKEQTNSEILAYPVIRLSEIIVESEVILDNTDRAVKNIRDNTNKSLLNNLAKSQASINKLWDSFERFDCARHNHGLRLEESIKELECLNNIYKENSPLTDKERNKYNQLKYNLMIRNNHITTLMQAINKVSEKYAQITNISREIDNITDFLEHEFRDVEIVNTD